uniref:SGNH hydrolase-type esterase domain-containing protein n=1 Tax=Mastacembelus armatus TaxID=205130 RepID=A0A3Q3NN20_9TELE
MPRGKGFRRSLAARKRRAEQLDVPLLPPPLSARRGTGFRHAVRQWPTSCFTGKAHKLVIPAESPDKKFVLIVGDSHLRSVVDGVVPMPECRMSFGISSTPGACARELQRELAETVLPRDPSLVCLLAPSNNLTASRTVDEAAAEFGHLLAYICSRWHKVCVLDFPPRLAGEVEVQTLLSQAYHRVSARMVHYYSTAEHFPRNCLELWSRDGVHLSDSHGMDILVQLLFEYCCLELETPAPTAPVAPGPSRSTRRASPKVVVTGPLPVPRPPPSEWTVVGQGSKVETVFSIPLSPVLFSPAMLVEMEKISPSHLGSVDCTSSFPAGKKVNFISNFVKSSLLSC